MAVAPEHREEAERLAREVDGPIAILPLPLAVPSVVIAENSEFIPSPKIRTRYEIRRYGPAETAPPELHELWVKVLKDIEKRYPLTHPALLAEAKRAEITPREMQIFMAHGVWLDEREKIREKWSEEYRKEEEEEGKVTQMPRTKAMVVFIGSCKVSEGRCLTHDHPVSKTARCPQSPLTGEEWEAAWELVEIAFPKGMSNPWLNGWWPGTLEEAERTVRKYADSLWDAFRQYQAQTQRAVENYRRSAELAIKHYRDYVMMEYEKGKARSAVSARLIGPTERHETPEELEFFADSPEFLTQTIDATGYRSKIDTTFQEAIARAKGLVDIYKGLKEFGR
jgi:hypothetical protein